MGANAQLHVGLTRIGNWSTDRHFMAFLLCLMKGEGLSCLWPSLTTTNTPPPLITCGAGILRTGENQPNLSVTGYGVPYVSRNIYGKFTEYYSARKINV